MTINNKISKSSFKNVLATAALSTLMFSSNVLAESGDANATVNLLENITVSVGSEMNFGTIVRADSSLEAIASISSNGTLTGDTNITIVDNAAAAASAFTVTAAAGENVTVTASGGTLTDIAGANPLSLTFTNALVLSYNGTDVANGGAIASIASAIVNLGAKLTIPANAPGVVYSTQNTAGVPVTLTVDYQ
jgi:hypothetical protein